MSTDDDLFAALRETWADVDPVPADLIERMIAVVAAADLTAEYALLTLVEQSDEVGVRGESDALTLQFTDGTVSVLIHVVTLDDGHRRVDGWVDAPAAAIHLEQDGHDVTAQLELGRFAFADVPPGLSRLRVVLSPPADPGELRTPQFEI